MISIAAIARFVASAGWRATTPLPRSPISEPGLDGAGEIEGEQIPHQPIIVRALWDADAGVWVATSDDVPGLVAEAATFEALRDTVLVRIGELIELNGSPSTLPEIVHILAEHTARVHNPAATP